MATLVTIAVLATLVLLGAAFIVVGNLRMQRLNREIQAKLAEINTINARIQSLNNNIQDRQYPTMSGI